jgi:hypothetical protein
VTQRTDWRQWHTAYDDPTSSLSRRLTAVREQLARVLGERRERPTQLVSICAGDGRDAIPVLAAGHRDVQATLVELDPGLAAAARHAAARFPLDALSVREADAGLIETYDGIPPADVFLACGVFGNVSDDDLVTTVRTLPQILAPEAVLIWTRGRPTTDPTRYAGDPADMVRKALADHDFAEEAFIRPSDAEFRVGVHRLVSEPQARVPGTRMFRFVR